MLNRISIGVALLSVTAGVAFSIIFHGWLLFTLSGLAFEVRERSDREPIETVLTDPPPTDSPLEIPEIKKYELANPGDRETEVGKLVGAERLAHYVQRTFCVRSKCGRIGFESN